MTVQLNEVEVVQPQGVNEEFGPLNTDIVRWNGARSRSTRQDRYVVTLEWTALSPADYQEILDELQEQVRYQNDLSHHGEGSLDIDTLAVYEEQEYLGGSEAKRPLSVKLYEIARFDALSTENGDNITAENGDILLIE